MEPQTSPFDLNFRLFGIPIRVSPWFWLFSGLFSFQYLQDAAHPYAFFFISIGCMFFSILVHEMGHAVTMRLFRLPARVILLAMGGVAISPFPANERWKRIAISLAGPAAGIGLLFLPLYFGQYWLLSRFPSVFLHQAIAVLLLFTGLWNVVNLLPVYPLDGGQATLEVTTGVSNRRGPVYAFGIGFITAGLVVLLFVLRLRETAWKGEIDRWIERTMPSLARLDPIFMIVIFGLLAMTNFTQMRKAESRPDPWD
jgi:Zn-dependent protease